MYDSYIIRKKQRKENFLKNIKGWKLKKCTSCNGIGYYDSDGIPPCTSCNGIGKERYRHSI